MTMKRFQENWKRARASWIVKRVIMKPLRQGACRLGSLEASAMFDIVVLRWG